jgi:hypothetical protein
MGLLNKARAFKTEPQKKEAMPKVSDKQPDTIILKTSYAAGKVIETDFDILYKLVLSKEKVKLSEITKLFSISKEKAEQWIQILDERGLVKIHYPAMGEPEVHTANVKTQK